MGGSSAPKPDKNIGLAALESAQVGRDHLNWMMEQAEVTNQWAAEDRARFTDTFIPLQDEFIEEAQNWDTPERRQAAAQDAIADTRMQARVADGTRVRQAMSMGVNPNSGKFQAAARSAANDTALAAVGAGNLARDKVEAQGAAKKANAINLGSGLAVNPGTSMGLSNGAASAGASAAMQGLGQQGQLLNTQYQQQMQQWQAEQQSGSSLMGGLGAIAGMVPWGQVGTAAMTMLSSKKAKTNRKPVKEGASLDAVRQMPVDEWDYKKGHGDEGRHIGTYAEDFAKLTGMGDGRTIDVPSAIGVTMGSVKDLDAKTSKAFSAIDAKLAELSKQITSQGAAA